MKCDGAILGFTIFAVALISISSVSASLAQEISFIELETADSTTQEQIVFEEERSVELGVEEERSVELGGVKVDKTVFRKASTKPEEPSLLILMFDKKPDNIVSTVRSLGGEVTHDFDIIEGVAVSIPGEGLGELSKMDGLVSIQENKRMHAFLSESIPIIEADDVWGMGYNGSGKTVCVVDSGIDYNHPALSGKVVDQVCYCCENGVNCNDSDSGCCPDNTAFDDDAMDDNSHGTHCAGIIASTDSTYTGVAPGASLLSVKALDSSGSGWMSDIIEGIDWCVAQDADVISLSLGGSTKYVSHCDSQPDAQAVNNAVDAGIVVSIASGNDGWLDGISSPACASKAISVGDVYDADFGRVGWSGCTDQTTGVDMIVCHCNRDEILDVLAPGALTTSTVLNDQIGIKGGTSMATPHVAGAAALLLQQDPYLTPAEIEQRFKQSGVSVYDSRAGLTFPRINVSGALNFSQSGYLEPYLISPTEPVNVTKNSLFTFSTGVKCVGGYCGDVTATLDPETELSYDDNTPKVLYTSPQFLWGVHFTSPFEPPFTLKNIRTMYYDMNETGPFSTEISLLKDENGVPREEILYLGNYTIDKFYPSWQLLDIDMEVNERDFWISMSSPGLPLGPYIMADKNSSSDTSCILDGNGGWAMLKKDLLIRAIITSTGEHAFYEGFESDFGAWRNIPGDDFDWQRNSLSTPSLDTGPSDAAMGTYYIYTESSWPNYPNKTSILEGPLMDMDYYGEGRIDFSYHMYGTEMGTLYLEIDDSGWTTLWSKTGNQGDNWYNASVNFSSYSGERKLRFRMVTGDSYTSDAAIDHITLTLMGAKGAIPMDDGSPFYTTDQNPVVCYAMDNQSTCNQTWTVNATGSPGESWMVYTIYDSDYLLVAQNTTGKINVTILGQSPVSVAYIPAMMTESMPALFDASGSYDPDGDPLSYFWDFEDGANSTEKFPIHVYDSPGVYTAELTVSDGSFQDSDSGQINVTPSPIQPALNGTTTNVSVTNNEPSVGQISTTPVNISGDTTVNVTAQASDFNSYNHIIRLLATITGPDSVADSPILLTLDSETNISHAVYSGTFDMNSYAPGNYTIEVNATDASFGSGINQTMFPYT